jgi:hypothetical protein
MRLADERERDSGVLKRNAFKGLFILAAVAVTILMVRGIFATTTTGTSSTSDEGARATPSVHHQIQTDQKAQPKPRKKYTQERYENPITHLAQT